MRRLNTQAKRLWRKKISQNEFRIVRLLSTVPSDYLCSELQPGTVITCKPVVEALS